MSKVTFFILVSGDIEFKVVLFLGNHKTSISVLEFVVRQSLQSIVPRMGIGKSCFLRGFAIEASTVRRLRSNLVGTYPTFPPHPRH